MKYTMIKIRVWAQGNCNGVIGMHYWTLALSAFREAPHPAGKYIYRLHQLDFYCFKPTKKKLHQDTLSNSIAEDNSKASFITPTLMNVGLLLCLKAALGSI